MSAWTNRVRCNGVLCVRPDPERFPEAAQLANSAYFPVGPNPGYVRVLMYGKDLSVFATSVTSEEDSSQSSAIHTVQFEQIPLSQTDSAAVGGSLVFTQLVFVKSVCIDGIGGGANSVYLVTLADRRIIASKWGESGNASYNLRHFAHGDGLYKYLPESMDIDPSDGKKIPWTWQRMLNDLWSKCPAALSGGENGTPPTLPEGYDPGGVPEDWRFIGVNPWQAYHAILAKISCTISYDPSGLMRMVKLGDPQTLPSAPVIYDADPTVSVTTRVPEKVRVWFYFHYQNYGQERDVELNHNWAWDGQGIFIDVPTLNQDAETGTFFTIWDDMWCELDGTNSQANHDALGARAEALTAAYLLDWITPTKLKYYGGLVIEAALGGTVKAVMWRNFGEGWVTEIACHPGLPRTKDGPGSLTWQQPLTENLLPPDLGRHSYPNYPRVCDVVQIKLNDGTPFGNQVTSGSGLFRGVIARSGSGDASWEECRIILGGPGGEESTDGHGNIGDLPITTAIQGNYYGPARLIGTAQGDSDGVPLYWLAHGADSGSASGALTVFELTDVLVPNPDTGIAGAPAFRCKIGELGRWEADDTQVIAVVSSYHTGDALWRAPVGARGLAFPRSDGKYEIIFMERPKMFAEFTIAADPVPGAGGYMCTLLPGSQYQLGHLTPVLDSNNQFFVADPNSLYPRIAKGAKGIAVYDDTNYQYRVVVVQQYALTATALCNDTGGMVSTGEVQIKSFLPTSPSPFNLTPIPPPESALNPNNHRCKQNDTMSLAWSEEQNAYVVVDVVKKIQKVPFNIRIKANKTQIEWQEADCAVEYATDPAWVDKIPLKKCT